MPLSLRKINISQFRCYDAARIDLTESAAKDLAKNSLIVLTGPNGAGKTNILEAISLLVPGKGLRGADLGEMRNRAAAPQDLWAVSAEIETADGDIACLGTGLARPTQQDDAPRRLVRIDGDNAKSQSALASLFAVIWLTPQMDRLFLDGTAARRAFLDRLVAAYTPEHASHLSRYNKAARERLKLLLNGPADPVWLSGLEARMAEGAVAIAAARAALTERLEQHAAALAARAPLFPQPVLSLAGWTENEIGTAPAVDIEDALKEKFAASRAADRAAGRTHEGANRSDLVVFNKEKNMPAAQSSTGEQKALLVSIILSHALMMRAEKGFTPVILLDEVAAHLDAARRDQLFTVLRALQGQVWLTGTDESVFSSLKNDAHFFRLEQGHIVREAALRSVAL